MDEEQQNKRINSLRNALTWALYCAFAFPFYLATSLLLEKYPDASILIIFRITLGLSMWAWPIWGALKCVVRMAQTILNWRDEGLSRPVAEGQMITTQNKYQAPHDTTISKQMDKLDPEFMLGNLHTLNDMIPDKELTMQINQIERITKEIIKRKEAIPEQEQQLNAFLRKHMPPLMDALEIYTRIDGQNIESKNLQRAKASVGAMLSDAIVGYKNKLNEMYSDDIMELTANVNVVKQMLQQDGLTGTTLQI